MGGRMRLLRRMTKYRSHQDYDSEIYLSSQNERKSEHAPIPQEKNIGRWHVRYSRLREITIFNKGKLDPKTAKLSVLMCV